MIKQHNTQFASENHDNCVCVFAGATSGIGASTFERIVSLLGVSTFYVLGRSETQFEDQRAKLQSLKPSSKIVFLEVKVSLISEVDVACKQITESERKNDFLYMSPGIIPLHGPQCKPYHYHSS